MSPDSVASHQKFKKKFELPFTLLADEGHRIADAYGVYGEKTMYGVTYKGVMRTTFIIDEGGVVQKVFEKVKPVGHSAEVAEAL